MMRSLKMCGVLFPLLMAALPALAAGEGKSLPVLDRQRTAVVITDPQNDFLREDGKLYPLLADNLKELGTIDNIARLMEESKASGVVLAVDPLVYTALDGNWTHAGALQRQLLEMKALHRATLADGKGLEGSGADFFPRYKPLIHDGKTIVVAPHKMYGPESNDLIYQLRSRSIDTVVLAGLVANLCVDSHMRALMENGFSVYVVKDAVAAPGADAYKAALVNFSMIANGVLTTDEAVKILRK
ncbi:MAG: cysteine hydrolase [Magnetospirillum sp.]|nr:cysteine hydrolase [Magnetospirillum sp.]